MSCCKLFICHSEDEGDRHMILSWDEGKLPAHERLVLDLHNRGGHAFNPDGEMCRVVDGDTALASYFSKKYGGDHGWAKGDPLSRTKEEDESDQEVKEFLHNRRKARKACYNWIIYTNYIEYTDATNEQMTKYIERLVMIASEPEDEENEREEWGREIGEAREQLLNEPDLLGRVHALEPEQFQLEVASNPSPFAKRQLQLQAEIADGSKRRKLEQQIASLKSELEALPS